MGYLDRRFVVGQTYKEDKILDKLCKKSEGMIVRVDGVANGEINYFMGWDGSKEGWDDSTRFDGLRTDFLQRLIQIDARWYEIDDDENSDGASFRSHYNPHKIVWQIPPDEEIIGVGGIK